MPRSRNVLAPLVAALLLLLLCGFAALRTLAAADDYRVELNVRRPPLAEHPPHRASAPPRLSRRVVLVIIDGLRLRDSYGQTTLDALRRAGVDAAALSGYPTYSRPNHVAILTGVPPALSGVRNNTYDWPVALDSLMARAGAAGMRSAYAADLAFGAGMMFHDDFAAVHYAPWPGGFAKAARLVVGQPYPLVVLLPGRVDAAGHAFGADSPEYTGALARIDGELDDLLSSIDLEHDTIIVTADHGHTDEGGHGGIEPDVMEVPLILAGAGVRPGAALARARVIDVAPTAAALLGLPAPGHSVGRTLIDALTFEPDARALIERADTERIARNEGLLARHAEQAGPAIARTRLERTALVAGLTLFGFLLLLGAWRLGAVHMDWRVILIAVPAFPLTYYALLDIMGQRTSPSALPDRDGALDILFTFGLLATVVQVAASWVALRGRVVLRDRLAAANALTATGMLIGWMAAGLLWARFGPRSAIEPPGPTVTVLVPATYIAAACHALAVAVTLGLEIVVFFARAVDPRLKLRRLERAAERERRRLEKPADLR